MTCLLCGRELDEGGRAALGSPSSGFLRFYTRGSEHSAVFSPDGRTTDHEHLVICICDGCLKDAGELGFVLHGLLQDGPGTPLPGEWEYVRWRLPITRNRNDTVQEQSSQEAQAQPDGS